MTRLSSLLLATDLKPHSDRAEARAFALARELDRPLHIITVDEGQPQMRGGAAAVERYLREAHGDLPFELTIATSDDPREAILAQAHAARCNLIVVGPKGERTLKERFSGGTLERLIAEAIPPLLVVQSSSRASYAEIVASTDFSDSSRYALETCAGLFPEARFILLHAYRVAFDGRVDRAGHEGEARAEAGAGMDRFIAALDPALQGRVRPELVYGVPEEVLAPFIQQSDAQLTLVGSHGRADALEKALGDIATWLLRNLPGDILLVREPRSRQAERGLRKPA